MAKKGNRQKIIIRHKKTGHSYHTTKNKRNTTEKVTLKKILAKRKPQFPTFFF